MSQATKSTLSFINSNNENINRSLSFPFIKVPPNKPGGTNTNQTNLTYEIDFPHLIAQKVIRLSNKTGLYKTKHSCCQPRLCNKNLVLVLNLSSVI